MSKDIKLYLLNYPETGVPIFKFLVPALFGDNVGPSSLLLENDTKDGDYIPAIFVDNFGRQSKLTYVPIFGPRQIKKDLDDVETLQEVSNHSSTHSSRKGSQRSGQTTSQRSKKKTSQRSGQTSNSSSASKKKKVGSKKSRRLGKNGGSSVMSNSGSNVSDTQEKHADIDEDKITMNFSNARENFDYLGKPLHNKFVKKLLKDFQNKVGEESETLLSKYTHITGFEVDDSDINLDDFSTEKPPGDIVKTGNNKDEIVFIKIVNQGPAKNDKEQVEQVANKDDMDFFLSSTNAAGAKEEGKMFLIINQGDELAEEMKLAELPTLDDFLDNEEIHQGRIRVTFIDDSKHLMSEPIFVRVVNGVHTDEKYDSVDETAVELNFFTFQKYTPNTKKEVDNLKLKEFDRIYDVEVVQDPLLASNTQKVDEIDELPIIELIGNDTVVKVKVGISRVLRNRLLLV